MPKCEYHECERGAIFFYLIPVGWVAGGIKFWVCLEHYDLMADYYKNKAREDFEDHWARAMVKTNGW